MARKGPGGMVRLARNGNRVVCRRWEQPAPGRLVRDAPAAAGVVHIEIELAAHEGGIAVGRRL